jgi:hypothetical protein
MVDIDSVLEGDNPETNRSKETSEILEGRAGQEKENREDDYPDDGFDYTVLGVPGRRHRRELGSKVLEDVEDLLTKVTVVYVPYLDPYAAAGEVYIPPSPSSDEAAELRERSEDMQESIGLEADVDNYEMTPLEGGAMAQYSVPRSRQYSENTIAMDMEFAAKASEEEKIEAAAHEVLHAYTEGYDQPTGDLLEEQSEISFGDDAVKQEMNKMDRLYEVATDPSYDETTREIFREELEKRTQWLTEAILGNRSENIGYQEKTSEFNDYMWREHGVTQHEVNGIYADDPTPADSIYGSIRGPTPTTDVARRTYA